jgi:hypothetical protein
MTRSRSSWGQDGCRSAHFPVPLLLQLILQAANDVPDLTVGLAALIFGGSASRHRGPCRLFFRCLCRIRDTILVHIVVTPFVNDRTANSCCCRLDLMLPSVGNPMNVRLDKSISRERGLRADSETTHPVGFPGVPDPLAIHHRTWQTALRDILCATPRATAVDLDQCRCSSAILIRCRFRDYQAQICFSISGVVWIGSTLSRACANRETR